MANIQDKIDKFEKLRMEIVKESPDDRLMTLSVGPQHPGSGHFRFTIKLDGDYIVYCDPDPGYVHRGEEKMCEYRNFIQIYLILSVLLFMILIILHIHIVWQ